jgi:sec-independent protein translocase protein TatA
MQLYFIITGILGGLGAPEIILIALIVLLLFGGKKIPELMHGLGKGVSKFKEGMNNMEDEMNKPPQPKKESDQDKNADHKSVV